MAVEAHHLNLFHPQLMANREFMNHMEGVIYNNNNQMGGDYNPLLSGTTTAETLLPAYNSIIVDSSVSPKSDHTLPLPRKRSRESMNPPFLSYPSSKSCSSFSFLGEDISFHIQQQQFDIDHVISLHLEKVRSEVEEKRKRQGRRIMELIEAGMMKRLKAKEEEIEKIGKLNWALEERVKSLSLENQIWRDMAQTNEAAVNTLRNNLEQVLYQGGGGMENPATVLVDDDDDDAQSSCGSNEEEEEEERRKKNGCRNCGKEESSVLLLPCRHLCLCTVCGCSVHVCPICKSVKNASVHVNMS